MAGDGGNGFSALGGIEFATGRGHGPEIRAQGLTGDAGRLQLG